MATKTATVLDELAAQYEGVNAVNVKARYEAQKENGVINPIVLASLMGVKPQMIYGYLRTGKLTKVDGEGNPIDERADSTNSTQKIVIGYNEANTWAGKYFGRKAEKAAKVQAELEGELADA